MQRFLDKKRLGQKLAGWGASERMKNEKDVPAENASMRFRSMRRRSKTQYFSSGSDDAISNLFNEFTGAAEPPRKPSPAHVEASTRKLGQVSMLLAPTECPDTLLSALRSTAGKVGRFCDGAYLFQAEYEAGETALMVCFANVDDSYRARIEGAVADALMASGHEDHSLGILFLEQGNTTLARIVGLAVDLSL